jgi:HK97 family phage major capsid protein
MQEEIAKLVELPDVWDTMPKVILDAMEVTRRKRATGPQLLKLNNILTRTKSRTAYVPSRGLLTAVDVVEGEDISTKGIADITYATTMVSAKRIGTYFKVSKQAIDATEIDVINDIIGEAGAAIADKQDDDIYSEFLGLGANANEVTSVNSGKIVFDDLVTAKVEIEADKFEPDTAVLSATRAGDILKDAVSRARFIDKSELPADQLLVRQLGAIAGLDIIVTSAVPDSTALVLDRKSAGWFLPKRGIDLMRDQSILKDSIEFAGYMEYGLKVTQPSAVCYLKVKA